MSLNRRDFIHLHALLAPAVLSPGKFFNDMASTDELEDLCEGLLETWGRGMLRSQVKGQHARGAHGGILCPACSTIHGRCGDAVFPFLHLYSKTKDPAFLQGALQLYDWMERSVSLPDGSWVNEVSVSDWKGTTVFGAVTLAHSLIHFGHLLPAGYAESWKARLRKAGQYVHESFTIATGNINYPVSACYALALMGDYLHIPAFAEKARQLAAECLAYLTPADQFIYGEGHPDPVKSLAGCYSVDLGYNVEESLPSLVLYARLVKDTAMEQQVLRALRTHAAFMLPDGAWDNSWGTRNFKWTWWGSRTSDGCQPGYALMADREAAFYTIALRNTQQMKSCTHDGLLYGGPDYHAHGVEPCIHHTLGHSKALALLLNHPEKGWRGKGGRPLPRAAAGGTKYYPEIGTWLVAEGPWRATATHYDVEYLMKGGHASGGALTMLWHMKAGAILTASMNRYQLTEPFNMQRDKADVSTCLTPRWELTRNGIVFSMLNDLRAEMRRAEGGEGIVLTTKSRLVDEAQQVCADGVACSMEYRWKGDVFVIRGKCHGAGAGRLSYVLPVICRRSERVHIVGPREVAIHKPGGVVVIRSTGDLTCPAGPDARIFNFVPGMEAVVLEAASGEVEITVAVR